MLNRSIFQNNKIGEYLLYLAVFCLPFQIFFVLYTPDWGLGFSNPYTSIHFYFFELLVLLSLLFSVFNGGLEVKLNSKQKILLGFLTLSFLVSVWFSSSELNSKLLFSLKYFAYTLFFLLLSSRKIPLRNLLFAFIFSALVQSFISVFQVLLNHDLSLQFLGEPTLNLDIPHLATFFSSERIRAYGTFSHPNILAFFLSFAFTLTLFFVKKWGRKEFLLAALLLAGVLASFSRTAALIVCSLLLFFTIQNLKTKWKWVLPPFFVLMVSFFFILRPIAIHDDSVQERMTGAIESIQMWQDSPFWGHGFRQYTSSLADFSERVLMPWSYQPTHNSYLLYLSEFGLIGFILLLTLLFFTFKKIRRKNGLLILAAVPALFACFEHFFLSLDQGLYLLIFIGVLLKRGAEQKGSLHFRLENPWDS